MDSSSSQNLTPAEFYEQTVMTRLEVALSLVNERLWAGIKEALPIGSKVYLQANVLAFGDEGPLLSAGTEGCVTLHQALDDGFSVQIKIRMGDSSLLFLTEPLHEVERIWGYAPPPSRGDLIPNPLFPDEDET